MGLAPINLWGLEVGRQLTTQSSKSSSMFDGPWFDPLCIFVSCEEEEAKMAVVNNPGEVEYESGTSLHILELHGPTMGYGTGALLLLVAVAAGAIAAYRWRRRRERRRREEEVATRRLHRLPGREEVVWTEAGPATGWPTDLREDHRWTRPSDLGRDRRWGTPHCAFPPSQQPPLFYASPSSLGSSGIADGNDRA